MDNFSQISAQEIGQVENLFKIFEDPLTHEGLEDPVISVACGHTFSRKTVDDLCASAKQKGIAAICPLDDIPIGSIIKNRIVSDALRGLEKITEQAQRIFKTVLSRELDSFTSAQFTCTQTWGPVWVKGEISLWMMRLHSITEGSFFLALDATGFMDGTIMISVTCQQGQEKMFKKHMSLIGLEQHSYRLDTFNAYTIDQRRVLLNLIEKTNNEIPGYERSLLKDLSEKKSWR